MITRSHHHETLFTDTVSRRDTIQMMSDLIKAAQAPTKLTKILHRANIQYNTFQAMKETLLRTRLIKPVPVPRRTGRKRKDNRTRIRYQATEAGLRWCKLVDEVYRAISTRNT